MKPNPNWRGDPVWLPEVLRLFGVRFVEHPGWKLWGMGDFGVIQGVFWHHTGARNTSAEYIRRNPGLSNALSSQFHTAPDGLQTILGAGIAWHAGRGWGHGWPTNNANPVSIGFEMQHNGTDPWPEEQLESTRRATAAILWFLGKRATPSTMIAHWEYSLQAQGKWDPGAGNGKAGAVMDMDVQRAKVNALIDKFTRDGTLDGAGKDSLTMADIEELKRHITAEHEATRRYIADFITGFVGPIGSDTKDIRQQMTGGRDAGQYPGWPQSGNRTLLDLVAAIAAAADVPGTRDTLTPSTSTKKEIR